MLHLYTYMYTYRYRPIKRQVWKAVFGMHPKCGHLVI